MKTQKEDSFADIFHVFFSLEGAIQADILN
jgi:hypothetical protein